MKPAVLTLLALAITLHFAGWLVCEAQRRLLRRETP